MRVLNQLSMSHSWRKMMDNCAFRNFGKKSFKKVESVTIKVGANKLRRYESVLNLMRTNCRFKFYSYATSSKWKRNRLLLIRKNHKTFHFFCLIQRSTKQIKPIHFLCKKNVTTLGWFRIILILINDLKGISRLFLKF